MENQQHQKFSWLGAFVKPAEELDISERAHAIYESLTLREQREFTQHCVGCTRSMPFKIAQDAPTLHPGRGICTATINIPSRDLTFVGVLSGEVLRYTPPHVEVWLHVVLPEEVFWLYGLKGCK